jgi:uncharacterized protein YyaL (SSP411 family)
MPGMSRNHLDRSTSPYLQQHADNPVHWWEWCDEALQLAREQDRPILLSIGYSACHWCHVMAHESFEDPATAAVMNELYVNIKVDREERPDLDKIYQTAHQLLSRRSGGWPLTVFLAPDDHTPFFAGTYFPPEARHGLPAFTELLRRVHAAWQEQRDAIEAQNRSLQQALQRLEPQPGAELPAGELLETAVAQLAQHFDPVHGGFGSAPKFPHPGNLDFLLRYAQQTGDRQARQMALLTLQQMANGGMHDQLGGGFCRYSVDDRWMIPHFEKMLYDNAALLAVYADAWQADQRRPLFRHVCERTAEWVLREMQAASGGYYSSLDADSEGGEGRFYVWQREEVENLLDTQEFTLFARRYGLDGEPIFEGRWNLHLHCDTDQLAAESGLAPREVRRHLKSARDKLFAARAQRPRPGRDEKILASWNALMIRGMARAGRLLDRPAWIDSAERALGYLRTTHWQDGRLLATSRDGVARLPAYLDDHAFLLDAILELLQARWRNADLAFARDLADTLLEHFQDRQQGGFFFTADDHERLLRRVKPYSDDAMPAGNAVAASALQRLGLLLGEPRYLEAAEQTLRAAAGALADLPYAHPGLLMTLQEHLAPVETVILRGDTEALQGWLQRLSETYRPTRRVFAIPGDVEGLPEALQQKRGGSDVLAYRCRGMQCDPPVGDIADL